MWRFACEAAQALGADRSHPHPERFSALLQVNHAAVAPSLIDINGFDRGG